MRKKSNIVVQKYIDDLAETQKNIDLNNLDEENEAAREEIDRDIYNNITDKIEVQDDDKKKNEHIKMYEEDENNSSHENEEDEDEDGDEIYCVSVFLIFIIF